MDALDKKLNDVFTGYVVRKDLVKLVKGNAAVPSYVLEYLLGQNCATDDEGQIEAGVERVRSILAKHYVQRAEAGAIRSDIKQIGQKRIIDKVSVILNEKRDAYEASFENLGVSKVLVSSDTVKKNRRLLVSGVWCIADLSYEANEARDESPYVLNSLKPIQMSRFDFEGFVARRSQFSEDEWIDVLIRSIGLDPNQLGRRAKLFQLTRLVTYCERNYNLVELGPKGTGKSHVFSEFSPHGILISGGEVTPAKLFVNNSTGKIGLVGYWDCVAFDEFAGKNKKPKADIVDIMKNYMANKSFSRGIEQVTAEASMVFVGNTSHDVSYMINKTDLLEDLPTVYHDPAFIDRLHAYIPGWEMDIIRGDMFCSDFGFIVDYLAEALRAMRPMDYSGEVDRFFELSSSISTRDRDGVVKTCAGLMKILFPGRNETAEEAAEIVEFALELRKRVKDTLIRIDETFERVDFAYRSKEGGAWKQVATLEELDYPATYHSLDKVPWEGDGGKAPMTDGFEVAVQAEERVVEASVDKPAASAEAEAAAPAQSQPKPAVRKPGAGHIALRENQRGVSYEKLFGAYLEGAQNVEIIDPYVRTFHQCRNVMELLEVVVRHCKFDVTSVKVHLITAPDEYPDSKQEEYLEQIRESMSPLGLDFTWEIDRSGTLHARHLKIDGKWDILLDRGLDIWQRFDSGNAFSIENRLPEMRRVKAFELTYMKVSE
ncbi:BREX system Lon protease-like protein BrxL [Collinsella sp. SGI.180]|uniref:BREX system Lon protease-like protein BrxL n=1 Tax=Collinsella sp. SGI.180 TaxID=3420555 RepID=UPI003D026EE9